MAAVDDAVADSGYGALEATDRTVDCRAADGARGRGRHIGSPGYHAHCASNDVHFDPCPRTSPAVSLLAIHQATPIPSPLTCEIVARVRAGCRCNLAACQSSTGGTRFERDRTIDRLHNFPSNHRLMCAPYGVLYQPPAESRRADGVFGGPSTTNPKACSEYTCIGGTEEASRSLRASTFGRARRGPSSSSLNSALSPPKEIRSNSSARCTVSNARSTPLAGCRHLAAPGTIASQWPHPRVR
jgi:hypothetical protein